MTSDNAQAKKLLGKISGGIGNGRRVFHGPIGFRYLNLGQIKQHMKSEWAFEKEQREYRAYIEATE